MPVEPARYLTFRGESQLYALPAAAVREVIRLRTVARVPQGPDALLGVANLRGAVVPVVGLRELVGRPASLNSDERLALVLDHATPTALVVDTVDTLETLSADQIDAGPSAWEAQGAEKLLGAFTVERTRHVAKILDIENLLAAAFAARQSPAPGARTVHGALARDVPAPPAARSELLVTFEVAAQEFALPLAAVEEILPLPERIARVARADAAIAGFAAVREGLMPLVAMRALLGFDDVGGAGQQQKVIVARVNGVPVGLIVDTARSVLAAELDAMEAVPPILAARTRGESQLRALYRGDGGRRLVSVLAPETLFREEVMQRLAAAFSSARDTRTQSAAPRGEERCYVVFNLGDAEFGLPIEAVIEVSDVPAAITRLPKTPKFLEGVVNLRGEVLPVVDQRKRFDMAKLDEGRVRRLVIVKTERHRAAIIVDSVSEVLRVVDADIVPPPQLTEQISRLVHGVINLQLTSRLVLLLDPAELLTRTEQGLLDAFRARNDQKAGV